jgi:hypothetical protein
VSDLQLVITLSSAGLAVVVGAVVAVLRARAARRDDKRDSTKV